MDSHPHEEHAPTKKANYTHCHRPPSKQGFKALRSLLLATYQPLFIIGTMVMHYHLLAASSWPFGPLENFLSTHVFGEISFEAVFYTIILPLKVYLWIILTIFVTVVMKRMIFPFGMKVGHFNMELERWEIKVNSWAYLRWWSMDNFFRCTTPFIFEAIIQESRLAPIWYYFLGMDIRPFQTSVRTPIGEVGEWDLWTINGQGTVFAMRLYGFDFDETGDRILFLQERKEKRDDVTEECHNCVPCSLAWIGLVPSTGGLGLAQYVNKNYFFMSEEDFHSFLSYVTLFILFIVFALAITIQLITILRIFCGETELGNMIVSCIDIIPKSFSFSILHVWWLRSVGVGVQSNQVFSGCSTPKNPSLVNVGRNVFISNTKITGPVSIGNNCFFGMKARVRPGTQVLNKSGVGGHSITHGEMMVSQGTVVVRNWRERLPPLYVRTIQLSEQKGLTRDLFQNIRVHFAYVFPKLLQMVIISAFFGGLFDLFHRIFQTPFFLLHKPTSYQEFLGYISFMTSMLVTMPVLFLGSKWLMIGKWRHRDLAIDFNPNSKECQRYFRFICSPIWHLVRAVWQPRFYGTWVQNLWYRLLGAKIGERVLIYSNGVEDYDHLHFEDDAAVCHGCFVFGHIWEGNGISFGDVFVRSGATIQTDRQVWPGGDIQSREIVHGQGQPIRGRYPRTQEVPLR